MTDRVQSMPVGIVIEWRRVDHPWQDHEWLPVAVIPGAAPVEEWKELARGDGWIRYLAATAPLELHRKETEGYKVNLSNDPPAIYVVLSQCEEGDAEHEVEATHVTVSSFEAQDYLDSGETIVEGVPMPEAIAAWVEAFVDVHHVDEPFRKRKRKRYDPGKTGLGRRPEPLRKGKMPHD
jgi:hypothetical protein